MSRVRSFVLVTLPVTILLAAGSELLGQAQDSPGFIASRAVGGEGMAVLTASRNGTARFAVAQRDGLTLTLGAERPAAERAEHFVTLYGARFGLRGSGSVRLSRRPEVDALGIEHVRFQQVHLGVPVTGAELGVHLRGDRVLVANGRTVERLPSDVTPTLAPERALEIVRQVVEFRHPGQAAAVTYTEPRLEVLNRGHLEDREGDSELVWFVEAAALTINRAVWIDAHTGGVLLDLDRIHTAKVRSIHDGAGKTDLPGKLVRGEGATPTADAEQNAAYDFSGITYDYFFSAFGRDSFDGKGATLVSTVNVCQTTNQCPMANAFWNRSQMAYGKGWVTEDVAGHELSHAVTQHAVDLLYYMQSGALNESYSDIFGETIDLLNTSGPGDDSPGQRWVLGEDLQDKPLRNMQQPNLFNDPAKMSDSQMKCDPDSDQGGVHSNSGIPNKAYALMVDGGSFNGRTVTGIGLRKAAAVQYRALTTYLTSASNFIDNYNALNQACSDLVGAGGLTPDDCAQVNQALLAVEMNARWNCAGAVAAPAACPAGTTPGTQVFGDGFEEENSKWLSLFAPSNLEQKWERKQGAAKGGTWAMSGPTPQAPALLALRMSNAFVIPAGARLYFDHGFDFENLTEAVINPKRDGGVIEYTTDLGQTWHDAGSLIEAGMAYNGSISSDYGSAIVPFGLFFTNFRQAFVKASFGYTGTRLNLSSLAGKQVAFQFLIGTDTLFGKLAWSVDNVSIHTCVAPVAPVITAQPAAATVKAGAAAQFTAAASGSPAPTWRWQTSSNGTTWSDITSGPYAGITTATLTIAGTPATLHGQRYRAVATNAAGSAPSAAATLSVHGPATVTPAALTFAAAKQGVSGPLSSSTAAQTVTVAFSGLASSWTASTNTPWLSISNAAGNGSGRLTIAVSDPANAIGASTSLTGSVTLTSATAPNAPLTIPVSLTVQQTGQSAAPFGQVDTPSQNAAGVVGAIGVTGWAMDDIGVASVKIYRNCLPFEPPANCQVIGGHAVVFVGDAAFLSGARPDVEAAFSGNPMAYRAGWGYLMMTSMLPHVTAQQSYGGQGALTLYAFATDVEGNVTLLGRSQADHTPTAITMANDSIAKPFGAIDTPGQGDTVSGIVHNFGWALTPDTDTIAGNGDVMIPADGSTMFVFIDGAPVATVAYNQCRGTVGNPAPAAVFCNDDVANIFGALTPQAALTPRAGNPTRHRNLDAGRAAIGAYSIDTTKLSNGLHTIAWSVTDSAGRTEGIGSRFFTVLNTASDAASAAQEVQQRPPVVHGRTAPGHGTADAPAGPSYRTGFNLSAPFASVAPDAAGVHHVALHELDRLELEVAGVDAAYFDVNGEQRDLPAGSSLRSGRFTWVPPAGYLGTYRLAFTGNGRRVVVDVTIGGR